MPIPEFINFVLDMGYLFLAIVFYILYRFIAGFVIPVVRATATVRKQFSSVKEQMEAQMNQEQNSSSSYSRKQQGGNTTNTVSQKPKYDIEGEYISFEENK